MSSFQSMYITLLRDQVDAEIMFLLRHGHNSDKIDVPCTFCVQHPHGYYFCRRLTELRQFQSTLITNGQTALRAIPRERRKIGAPIEDTTTIQPLAPISSNLNSSNLPLLSITL